MILTFGLRHQPVWLARNGTQGAAEHQTAAASDLSSDQNKLTTASAIGPHSFPLGPQIDPRKAPLKVPGYRRDDNDPNSL